MHALRPLSRVEPETASVLPRPSLRALPRTASRPAARTLRLPRTLLVAVLLVPQLALLRSLQGALPAVAVTVFAAVMALTTVVVLSRGRA